MAIVSNCTLFSGQRSQSCIPPFCKSQAFGTYSWTRQREGSSVLAIFPGGISLFGKTCVEGMSLGYVVVNKTIHSWKCIIVNQEATTQSRNSDHGNVDNEK